MGLNDEVELEIKQTENDKEPAPNTPVIDAPPHECTPAAAKPSEHEDVMADDELFNEPLIEGEMPDFEGSFVLHGTYKDKLDDLQQVTHEIKKEGISRNEAMAIESIHPGFLTNEFPIGMYTMNKTSVMKDKALVCCEQYIEEARSELWEGIHKTCESLLSHTYSMIKAINQAHTVVLAKYIGSVGRILSELNKDDIDKLTYTYDRGVTWRRELCAPVTVVDHCDDDNELCKKFAVTPNEFCIYTSVLSGKTKLPIIVGDEVVDAAYIGKNVIEIPSMKISDLMLTGSSISYHSILKFLLSASGGYLLDAYRGLLMDSSMRLSKAHEEIKSAEENSPSLQWIQDVLLFEKDIIFGAMSAVYTLRNTLARILPEMERVYKNSI